MTDLLPAERQHQIIEIARAEGRAEVASLAALFGVTTETVRRDLSSLENVGLLRRVHGGAVPTELFHRVPEPTLRALTRPDEKRRIATRALAELPPSGAVIIDSGTTTGQLADLVPAHSDLTVITNSLQIAQSLLSRPKVTVLQLGGRVRRTSIATIDDWTLRALETVSVDVAFIGTYGVSARRGFTTPHPGEGAVKRAMISAANRSIVLADATKVGEDHLSIFASLDEVDMLITDDAASAPVIDDLRAEGLEVVVASDPD